MIAKSFQINGITQTHWYQCDLTVELIGWFGIKYEKVINQFVPIEDSNRTQKHWEEMIKNKTYIKKF